MTTGQIKSFFPGKNNRMHAYHFKGKLPQKNTNRSTRHSSKNFNGKTCNTISSAYKQLGNIIFCRVVKVFDLKLMK